LPKGATALVAIAVNGAQVTADARALALP